MTKIRRWLHERGLHQLCRTSRVVDRVAPGFDEYILSIDGERLDVTHHSGPRTIYKTIHY